VSFRIRYWLVCFRVIHSNLSTLFVHLLSLSSEFYPVEASVDGGNDVAPIKMVRTKHGGHLGFMFHQLSETEKALERPASWMPLELARFVSHVHDNTQ
jgi:hypothetical protein